MNIDTYNKVYKLVFLFILGLLLIGLIFLLGATLLDGINHNFISVVGMILIIIGLIGIPVSAYVTYKIDG